VETYKEIRNLIQFGQFYRLLSPFEGNETAWLFTNDDQSEAIVFYFSVLAEPAAPLKFLRVIGINPDKEYQLVGTDQIIGGDELMYVGVNIPVELRGDFQSYTWHLKEVK
jgi:alpha-galactosidase